MQKENPRALQLINTIMLTISIGVGAYIGTQTMETKERVIRIEANQIAQSKTIDDLSVRIRTLESNERRLVKADGN